MRQLRKTQDKIQIRNWIKDETTGEKHFESTMFENAKTFTTMKNIKIDWIQHLGSTLLIEVEVPREVVEKTTRNPNNVQILCFGGY